MAHPRVSNNCAAVVTEADEARQSVYKDFYLPAVTALNEAGVPFLVGGAYAFERFTGIERDLKDFDIFVRPEDCRRALDELAKIGYQTDLAFSHWLGKAVCSQHYIDVIFNSGNGVARVDDEWFEHAIVEDFLGMPIKLCPIEETIWSKAFVMERERYDGADVAHLLLACGKDVSWRRLLERFGPHWRLLLSHIILSLRLYLSVSTIANPSMDRRRLAEKITRGIGLAGSCETDLPGYSAITRAVSTGSRTWLSRRAAASQRQSDQG